jgi:DNA-binding HxlR family transcriptional regulator
MLSTTPLDDLIALGKQRWMAAVLADIGAHKGARFVALINRLSLPRDTLTRTLEAAQALGWVMRNPGHGHPLRPEYILTGEGARIAEIAARQRAAQAQFGLAPGTLTRWGLPILHALDAGYERFNHISRLLTPASPRALSQGFRTLATHDLITRALIDDYPPISLYRLTESGRVLVRVT